VAEDQDESEKTEEPTQKRIQDAAKKGQVAFSREVSSFLMLFVLALNIVWFAPYYTKETVFSFAKFLHSPHDIRIDDQTFLILTEETIFSFLSIMSLPILAAVFVALFSGLAQNGLIISAETIMPKLEKISPLKGLKRLFSMKSFVEFIKGLIKISLIAAVSIIVIYPEIKHLENLVSHNILEIITLLASICFKIVLGACIIMALIATIDFLYQRFEYMKSLKMSRRELKEEYKQTEGDPMIKSKLRQIRMERAQKRMMAAVPDADVIIRNPEHYAIALKYDEAVMAAPTVVAMGLDRIALKIIEVAEEHDIPLVRNPPLARALYDSCELDEEIPLEHYQAVAEVIGYVYRLKGKVRA